jgi:hypothetical protein
LIIDGVAYHSVDLDDVPSSVADVPVKLWDNGETFDTVMVAGLVGTRLSSSPVAFDGKPDTLSPVAGWWIVIEKSKEELRLEQEAKAEAARAERRKFEEMISSMRSAT